VYGALEFIKSSPFMICDFDPQVVMFQWSSLAACLATAIILATKKKAIQIVWLLLLSATFLGTLWETKSALRGIHRLATNYVRLNSSADSLASHVLRERIRSGRALRNHNFDLYLPPASTAMQETLPPQIEGKVENIQRENAKGLILLPGAYVDHTAYAPVAAMLSDAGVAVAVVSMEPMRLATQWLGASLSTINQVAQRATAMVGERSSQGGAKRNVSWYIGGHSLGAYAAMNIVKNLEQVKQSSPRRAKTVNLASTRLIVWAAGSFHDLIPDLTSCHDLQVLFIFGANDLTAVPSKENFQYARSRMPEKRVHFGTIPGANHNGFAAYQSNPTFDGVRTIALDKQHHDVAKLTSAFLSNGSRD
jgi:hypothetical protein